MVLPGPDWIQHFLLTSSPPHSGKKEAGCQGKGVLREWLGGVSLDGLRAAPTSAPVEDSPCSCPPCTATCLRAMGRSLSFLWAPPPHPVIILPANEGRGHGGTGPGGSCCQYSEKERLLPGRNVAVVHVSCYDNAYPASVSLKEPQRQSLYYNPEPIQKPGEKREQ